MVIDDNPVESEAMSLFKKGEWKEGERLQDAFLAEIRQSAVDHCPCPATCKLHGKCFECVAVHRGHGDHLPHCFHAMVNRRIEQLSSITEHSFTPPPKGY